MVITRLKGLIPFITFLLLYCEIPKSEPRLVSEAGGPRFVLEEASLEVCQQVPQGVSIGSGAGTRGIIPYRLGYQHGFENAWLKDTAWPITGYTEFSYYNLQGKRQLQGIPGLRPDSHNHLWALALGFVLRLERACAFFGFWPYFEAGFGGAWLSQKEISGRALGMHFEFEDRIGAGFRFGPQRQFDIGYRFIHFSNACLAYENNGINLQFLILGYWF